MRARAVWLLFLCCLAGPAAAQVRPPRRPVTGAQQPSVRRDTTRRDTTAADSASAARLRLSPPDSVMQALLAKPGYNVTRYEGAQVTFDAANDLFQIVAGEAKRALVQRGDSQTVFADTGIYFNQRTKVASASGGLIILHDPTSGQADIVGRGRLATSGVRRVCADPVNDAA